MSRLWAVTSYFNPSAYRTKLVNYRLFRRRLEEVPLLAVELSHNAKFELGGADADVLVQLRGGDVMWQKERLLNVAISRLPKECEYVAWLDCDIVFGRKDWVSAAIRELEQTKLCQLYRTVHHLRADAPCEAIGREFSSLHHDSIGYASVHGLAAYIGEVTDGVPGTFKRGHAWCARRELIAEHGLYDRNVLGSGDKMLAFAVTGQGEELIARDNLAPGHAADYRRWVSRFRRDIDRFGYIEGDIFHLWHGDLKNRLYFERLKILTLFRFDPAVDIAVDTEGCWRWNSPKPEMHQRVRQYFDGRNEDGVAPANL